MQPEVIYTQVRNLTSAFFPNLLKMPLNNLQVKYSHLIGNLGRSVRFR